MRRTRTIAPAVAVALIAALWHPTPRAAQAAQPVVTVSVTSAPLPAVLQAVARAAGVSIIADSTVPQDVQVTVHLRATPLPAAWALLEQAYGLWIRQAAPSAYVASRAAGQPPVVVRPPGWDGTILRVFRLQHAQADLVAQALASLFAGSTPPASQPQGQPAQAQQPQQQPAQQPQQQPAPQQQAAALSIAAVPETNQILVRAPEHLALQLASAIRAMDQPAGEQARPPAGTRKPAGPSVESYTLRYARPSAVARILTEQISGLKVSADDTQNTIVVTGSEQDHRRVRQILETLDRPLAQIAVDAEVFSVQDSVERTLGIDWNISAQYTISLDPGKLDPFQIVARLQAAARDGRARVVSRPRILTISGEQATITVGDQIPIVGLDQQGRAAVVQTINAGMRLQVTPRLMPDGNVELLLVAEANTLSGFVQNFPIISQRSAQTRLVVRDQTPVIIGGLIGENRSTASSGLPFLADLPLLGALFRTTTTRTDRVELVIVVTPRIVSSGPIQR